MTAITTPTQCKQQHLDDDDITVKASNRSHDRPNFEIKPNNTPFPSRAKAWSKVTSGMKFGPHALMNTAKIKNTVDIAIADAGATAHFAIPGVPVINKRIATTPLIINLPDGEQLQSSHTCELDITWLPRAARIAHIVPGLQHTSLISIKVLCDAGCKVSYDDEKCKVYFRNKLVWHGGREPTTQLWVLPLCPKQADLPNLHDIVCAKAQIHCANNPFTTTSKAALIRYLHQALFSPRKATLLNAIRNQQLPTWPGLTANVVRKYLPETSPQTDKGHMKRQRKDLRSTKPTQTKNEKEQEDMTPKKVSEDHNHLFAASYVVNNKDGTMYSDLTGNFPLQSLDGMMTILVIYDWTSNVILALPIKDAKDETLVSAFKTQVEYLAKRGFKPKFNIIGNVASKAIKKYLEEAKIGLQLVEPHNHCVNAAERAIQTFKNHFIAGLSTCDSAFPTALWSRLVKQGQGTLNMLRTSRIHPKISAFHCLEGVHNFNRVPFAPPGQRATIFNSLERRPSWGPRALDAWYANPAWHHYRCWEFYVPSTGGFRISGQANFYPQYSTMPQETDWDSTKRLAHVLTQSL
jgi:hypothetical protein